METVREAVSDVVAAANAETQSTVAAVIEGAAAQVEQAQENAQQIAEAAMATELGRQINETRREISECQGNLSLLRTTMETLTAQMSELQATVAASLTLQAATLAPPNVVSVSPIPLVSETLEAAETIAEALPGNLSENAVVESPVPAIVKAKRRFL